MKFTKMHGIGNDYVYVNGMEEHIPMEKKPELIRTMSRRHFGVGSDGVIFINAAEEADFEMEMWNADGTRGEMCGNGIRCVAKYVYDMGLTDKTQISIVSAGKIKYLDLTVVDGKVKTVKVNMGTPDVKSVNVPVLSDWEESVDEPILIPLSEADAKDLEERFGGKAVEGGWEVNMTNVSMGNPHTVVFLRNVADFPIEKIGPLFEHHARFPERTNTEFVKVIDRKNVEMRVWERGSAETLACGTGSCATTVACVLNGLTDEQVTVKLLGGLLDIDYRRSEGLIFMTGPAEIVYHGEWPEEF